MKDKIGRDFQYRWGFGWGFVVAAIVIASSKNANAVDLAIIGGVWIVFAAVGAAWAIRKELKR